MYGQGESIIEGATKENVEAEKCVVAGHRTTIEQKQNFVAHLTTCPKTKIPIEWVIGE